MKLPDYLSVSRIILIFPIIYLYEFELYLLSLFVFILASITDYLDGFLARKNNKTSELGALLDLLADKLFISILLVWMTFVFDSFLIFISSVLIISREISIGYARIFFISKSKDLKDVKSDFIGKFKTAIQMIGLGFILVSPLTSEFIFNGSLALVFFSGLISWYSLISYINSWNV